ncbi:MAG: YeeE/YedE thiosulfate transporter family protein [Pseudomonadota bacterium]
MAPYDIATSFGITGSYLIYLGIGFCFGFILESSGFGDSRRLAGQFYFRELRVLKVMFTAIVVAMLLVFWSTALGLLDFDDIMVKETWLWPGIVGGFIMGVGFILGGYCPGTSLVSVATLKVDGMFFLLGLVVGILAFGETIGYINAFWNSSYLGRFILPELFGLDIGVVVVLVVCLAIAMFLGFGWIQQLLYGRGDPE